MWRNVAEPFRALWMRCGERGRQTPLAFLWKAAALRRVRLWEEKSARPNPRAKEKRTTQADRAQTTLHASASGMAKTQEQRIAYLTYPVRAGITVTFSRGISPHSAASLTKPAHCPVIHLYIPIVQHAAQNCNREFTLRRIFRFPPPRAGGSGDDVWTACLPGGTACAA